MTKSVRDEQRHEQDRSGSSRFRVGHCWEALTGVLGNPTTPADAMIGRFFQARRYLGSHDRGYIAETIYGILRGIIRTRWILGIDRMHPEDEACLLLAAAILPPEGEVTAQLADVITNVLGLAERDVTRIRNLVKHAPARIEQLPPLEATAVRTSVPLWFAGRIMTQFGADEGSRLLESLGDQAPIALRANTLRTTRDELVAALHERDIHAEAGANAPDAVVLTRRMNANAIPEFKSGWFELQDEGSQLLSVVLDPHPNWTVFDACAGAGGKTLHLAAIMKGRGAITAHDTHDRRLGEIRPRLKRSSAQNVRVMTHSVYLEQRASLAGSFDAVIIDAPCTGAGVFRRNPGAWLSFEESTIGRLVSLQRTILGEYAALVKPGGLLLYATCSLLRDENEDQVERFLATHEGWRVERPDVADDMITGEGFFRVFPHRQGTDGFFGALLRRA